MEGPGLILPGSIPGISPQGMPWQSGRYYDIGLGTNGTGALTANTLYAVPIMPVGPSRAFNEPVSIDRIAAEVTTAAAAGKLLRIGLYTMGADGLPASLLVDSGALAADGVAAVEATIALSLPAGIPVYRAIVSDGTPTVRTEGTTGARFGSSSNVAAVSSSAQASFTFGALPGTFPTPITFGTAAVRIVLRKT